jgi:hypothetical protein
MVAGLVPDGGGRVRDDLAQPRLVGDLLHRPSSTS